jgi:hypothetical protein
MQSYHVSCVTAAAAAAWLCTDELRPATVPKKMLSVSRMHDRLNVAGILLDRMTSYFSRHR